MKRFLWAVAVFASCFFGKAQDANSTQPTPQQVANQVISAFKTGHRSQIAANATNYIQILDQGSHDFPGEFQIFYALALCDMEENNKKDGLINIEKAYLLSDKNINIGALYVLGLKVNNQPLKACEVLKDMMALNPNIPQLQIQLATIEMAIQKYEAATGILESLLQKAPGNLAAQDRSALLYMLGTCYLYTGNHTKAIDTLESALAINPKMTTALAVLGEAYLKVGETEKAGSTLDQALAINANFPPALYYKGLVLEKAGNHEIAQADFQSGYANGKRYLDGDNGEYYYWMYLLGQKLGKNEESQEFKEEAAKRMFTYEAPWQTK